ncbi:hypothetical protein ZIOFF_026046 [Zingiber officinale]|uniref:NAC domain-containing protein n=1 Tax=Zingiber officinale TaxID=94328 RepID=A0A8J5GV55_ZINOF|nr:hypothetical protein ZIOFF_026046 [Zingiber officinale]
MLLLLRAMVGFQALHLKLTKPRTELKKKKEIIVEMLTARKSNEKKGAVEEHNLPFHFEAITEIELYKFAPWDLPGKSQLHNKDLEWYFFCARDRKYPNGSRENRTTGNGY